MKPKRPSTFDAQHLELDRVLLLAASHARTGPGRDALLARRPSTALDEAERLQGELAEMTRHYLGEGNIPLAGLIDPAPLFAADVMELDQSYQVLRSVRATQALRETFTRLDPPLPRLQRIAEAIPDLGEVSTNVGRFFGKDGKLREEASAELRSLRTRIHAKRQQIQKTLSDLMSRHAEAIQDPIITLRQDRYVIPVRSDRRTDVPGILHGRSGSGASFFIEPLAVVDVNNDLADLIIQEREEIARITRHVARLLTERRDDIELAVSLGGELDAIQAATLFGERMEAHRPLFTEEKRLRLIAARHPLLDERLAEVRASVLGETAAPGTIVPTTLELEPEHPALVISGPNAGGKTVALKTAGLLVSMGLAGLPVPAADGSVIPVVDAIHVLIGDDQSVMEHLSTFSADLVRIGRIIDKATDRSLVLLDELGSGTDPEEGGALASAIIEHVLDCGALLIVTTHLAAVKSYAVGDPRVANASMEFDADSGRPTFRMIPGVPGRSRAIDVAAMIGLPAAVIDKARARLGGQYGDIDSMVAELQKGMSEVVREREEIARKVREADFRTRELEKKLAEVSEEKKKLAGKWRDEMDRVKAEVSRNLSAELRRLKELDREARKKEEASRSFATVTVPIDRNAPEEEAPSREPRVGDKVEHRTFRVTGDLVSVDGRRATIRVGGKTMQASFEDLRVVGAKEAKKAAAVERGGFTPQGEPEEPPVSAELNLIGRRVDEAIDEVETFLDQALMSARGAVRVIHGHGTGALKNAIREQLRKHPAVRSFRPGKQNEGGDGATIVLMDV